MTNYNSGDIVLVRFPFTDLTTHKRRPVLVISTKEFSTRFGDVVVVPLTGKSQETILRLEKWREAGLLKPTWFKPLIATVAESLIEERLGMIHREDLGKTASVLKLLIDARFFPTS